MSELHDKTIQTSGPEVDTTVEPTDLSPIQKKRPREVEEEETSKQEEEDEEVEEINHPSKFNNGMCMHCFNNHFHFFLSDPMARIQHLPPPMPQAMPPPIYPPPNAPPIYAHPLNYLQSLQRNPPMARPTILYPKMQQMTTVSVTPTKAPPPPDLTWKAPKTMSDLVLPGVFTRGVEMLKRDMEKILHHLRELNSIVSISEARGVMKPQQRAAIMRASSAIMEAAGTQEAVAELMKDVRHLIYAKKLMP